MALSQPVALPSRSAASLSRTISCIFLGLTARRSSESMAPSSMHRPHALPRAAWAKLPRPAGPSGANWPGSRSAWHDATKASRESGQATGVWRRLPHVISAASSSSASASSGARQLSGTPECHRSSVKKSFIPPSTTDRLERSSAASCATCSLAASMASVSQCSWASARADGCWPSDGAGVRK
eukprot:scaffold2874_cov116-Isochrysis_galbana.AAC.7